MLGFICALVILAPALTLGESDLMENFMTSDEGKNWLQTLMKREGFNKDEEVESVSSYEFSPFDPPGTHYGSNRTRVDMTLLLKSCKSINTSVVVVDLPDSIERQKQLSASGLFDTDINVYEKVLPKMDELIEKSRHYRRGLWTKSIELTRPSRLVLNNVENNGYKRKDKSEGLNMEYCKVAVADLAKFHAISAVLNSQGRINGKQDFDLSLSERNAKKIGDWYGKVFMEFAKSIRAAWGPEWESSAQKIDEKAKTITEDYLRIKKRNDSQLNVLVNGAFTVRELFFNYGCSKDESSPVSSKMINFQNTFWNSPAMDLQVFINSSPQPEIITDDALRNEIISHYAQKLREYLKLYGFERKVSSEDIKSEMSRTELTGFATAVNALSGMYLRPEDSAYTEKFIEDALKNKEIRIDSKGMILPRFIKVMKKLVDRAQKLGII